MKKHFTRLYQADADRTSHATPYPPAAVSVTESEVRDAINRLPISKAGLPGSSPGAIWRLCTDQVAGVVATDLCSLWQPGTAGVPND